jgi:hypothetical protein
MAKKTEAAAPEPIFTCDTCKTGGLLRADVTVKVVQFFHPGDSEPIKTRQSAWLCAACTFQDRDYALVDAHAAIE